MNIHNNPHFEVADHVRVNLQAVRNMNNPRGSRRYDNPRQRVEPYIYMYLNVWGVM
jgi:hypothetical protein